MPLVAIDLGCHTARACSPDGRVCVALRTDAAKARGRARPLSRGVVVDVAGATRLVGMLLRRVRRFPLGTWRAVVCAPASATRRERAALVRTVTGSGARVVALVPEPLAAAIGSGMDVGAKWAQLVVDVGHGVTDAAVVRAGRLVAAAAPGPGCVDVQRAIAAALAARPGAAGPVAAGGVEAISRELALLRTTPLAAPTVLAPPAASADDPEATAATVLAAADAVIARIATQVARFVAALPPKTGCEVIESGILLSGGGALLDGMAARLATTTGIRVRIAPRPLPAVLDGARDVLVAARAAGLAGERGGAAGFALDPELR